LIDRKEASEARVQAAMALKEIGEALRKAKLALPPADTSLPPLVEVLQDKNAAPKVRERVLWAVAPYAKELPRFKVFFVALESILSEPKTKENKMLRYEAAYFLGVFLRDKVSEKALDVLHDFLKDESMQLYQKSIHPPKRLDENRRRPDGPVDQGVADARLMVIQALRRIGYERVKDRRDILDQLRSLRDNKNVDPNLRERIREMSEEFHL
jgi:hypothetical protein